MADARLLAVEVQSFKSYEAATKAELAPLTVILGRNNSGKSTLIQALLLLKQTLAHPRPDVPINLEGFVDALSLRELAYGGHVAQDLTELEMPSIAVTWQSRVDVSRALEAARYPDVYNLVRWTRLGWLLKFESGVVEARTQICVRLEEREGRAGVQSVELQSEIEGQRISWKAVRKGGRWVAVWQKTELSKVDVDLDHFLPYPSIDRSRLGPRERERAYYNGYLILFTQPIEDLKRLLQEFHFLGSTRVLPPPLYRPASVPPEEVGVSGEYAAQLMQARQREVVHYLPPVELGGDGLSVSSKVRARSLTDGVNDVLGALGIDGAVSVREIQNVGFQLLFGGASLVHVGRGLTYLLPVVELGLLADPLRFTGEPSEQSLEGYRERCDRYVHIALEEPEAHLHPKVQSRLAHWLVALAMANRQVIVETHSDHLVRRLRGLIARAEAGSEMETWLRENVVILEVEQRDGRSFVTPVRLTREGGLGERWPSDFMDEASEEESAIYYAGLDKADDDELGPLEVRHDEGPEPEGDEP